MAKQSNGDFPKKWLSKLDEGWVDAANSMQTDELKNIIVTERRRVAEIEGEMDRDDKLNALKEDVKVLVGGYHDAQKAHDAKVRYAIHLLQERGS